MLANKAIAFGGYGHELVCQMAFDALPKTQQLQLNDLVQALPQHEKQLLVRGHKPVTFAQACNWPDKIKRFKKYDKYKPWHYLNTSRDDQKITADDCQQNCVAKGIIHHQKKLMTSQTSLERAQAALFLSHWLADLHQPLHVSFASDLGGNKTRVKYDSSLPAGRCKNLHWYWDECLIMSKKLSISAYAQQLSDNLNYDLASPWRAEFVWQWADESFALVRSESFNYCHTNNGECQTNDKSVVIDKTYQDKHVAIAEQQVQKAAQRLANILAQSL
ncbi:S1/P1 nuclease [Thalassotalea sp. LPB0316]|uniref:S1/P1 nuclease n=1 Tax=Thalassotalea sp. LPB0316 TaxID=2769490 RepID=UPI0018679E28|nr:S1/P1 nuclease [Thalassotalea sp. LPB0316]QOL26611.1 S1/P1 nuclease [Thalassotalea sp. LPB0316]